MSKRKGNLILTNLFFVCLIAWCSAYYWTRHKVTEQPPPSKKNPAVTICQWKEAHDVISSVSYVCDGEVKGWIYKDSADHWVIRHGGTYESKERAIREEQKKADGEE